jgi:biotin-(acetyl-CoA carboxylase) ligase
MTPQSKARVRTRLSRGLDLPPPFRLVSLREVGDAFVHATAIAADEGAGTLVHVGRFDVAEFAVVLEPEEPLRTARRVIYTGMCALGDALAAVAPPEKAISFDWPNAIRVDGGLVGGVRLAWPPEADEHEAPAWLVFGAMIRLVAMGEDEPGLRPLASALDDEGFGDLDAAGLVEGFARHFMSALDVGQERGFGAVARAYLSRLAPITGAFESNSPGTGPVVNRREIDMDGNLLVRHAGIGGSERRSLTDALAMPSWFDPASGGPRR